MQEQQYDYGMIGLGTMGRNLVFNMNDHGYSVAGYDKDLSQVTTLQKESGDRKIFSTGTLPEFINALKKPRVIMMLVPAGPIVDAVVNELKPFLSKDDLLMDCGNSHYTDTDKRTDQLAKENIHFMGVGVSGGESGARYGPSIMPGGAKEAYQRVAPMLEAVSAKINGEPCVTYLGIRSAGHYVKMVHNGIEYALMQLIAESYHLLKECAGMGNDELHEVYSKWNKGKLGSFLIEITADIFKQPDELAEGRLIDHILDSAHQKGTGQWTSQDAMDLQMPIPAIDTAVAIRDLSAFKEERQAAEKKLKGPDKQFSGNKEELVTKLEDAVYFAMINIYAQGLSLMQHASAKYNYGLKMEDIARIWRGGCIIRASLLEDIRTAFSKDPSLSNLLLGEGFPAKLETSQLGARSIIQTATETGIPLPVLMSTLSYYDSYRRGWLPSNLLQAQRDYFGAHTYERTDRKGIFHTHWNQKQD